MTELYKQMVCDAFIKNPDDNRKQLIAEMVDLVLLLGLLSDLSIFTHKKRKV